VLAYLFWHRPADAVDAADYERRLAAFHDRLRAEPPPGCARSAAFRVGSLPWLADGGYEDWYLVDDWSALGVLNAAAVDAAHLPDHEAVATLAADGAAAVYALRAGSLAIADAGTAAWYDKPRGEPQAGFEVRLVADRSAEDFALWQRQLVLGPAPEFCLLARGSDRVRVTRA
jgi:hypothetical protein